MRKSNLTYEQLIELAPKDKCFYIEVESNPEGKGGRQKLLAFLTEDGKLFNTYFTEPNQVNINGIEYFGDWKNNYKGTFELIGYVRPVEKVEEKEEIITVNGKKYKLIEDK